MKAKPNAAGSMPRTLYYLLAAQFLSVFADNTLMFTVVAIVMRQAQTPSWYIPALQSVFLVSFVALAPWLGGIADRRPKARVLIAANAVKALGGGLLFAGGVEPLAAYSVVGLGAALYSPAKYGILPELAGHGRLIAANSWIEGSTILAILAGTGLGAKIADYSIPYALGAAISLFLCSALISLALPRTAPLKPPAAANPLRRFLRDVLEFLRHPRCRFAVLGGSLFWGSAACIRVILLAWAPLVLGAQNVSDISELILFLAIGIILGSAATPWLIPLNHLRRARYPALLMGLFIIALGLSAQLWPARAILLALGAVGGLFIVPINASLQDIGYHSIGGGSAVAMQNFFQNAAMLTAVGAYTAAASLQVGPAQALLGLGALELIGVMLLMRGFERRV